MNTVFSAQASQPYLHINYLYICQRSSTVYQYFIRKSTCVQFSLKSLVDHGRPLYIVYNCTSETKNEADSTWILYKRLSAPVKELGTRDIRIPLISALFTKKRKTLLENISFWVYHCRNTRDSYIMKIREIGC